jgi:hypothetical protein
LGGKASVIVKLLIADSLMIVLPERNRWANCLENSGNALFLDVVQPDLRDKSTAYAENTIANSCEKISTSDNMYPLMDNQTK